ncbi:hypothetical protein T439DRAFT_329266 [Meredithblackwellia eburnea MCA 4105]
MITRTSVWAWLVSNLPIKTGRFGSFGLLHGFNVATLTAPQLMRLLGRGSRNSSLWFKTGDAFGILLHRIVVYILATLLLQRVGSSRRRTTGAPPSATRAALLLQSFCISYRALRTHPQLIPAVGFMEAVWIKTFAVLPFLLTALLV